MAELLASLPDSERDNFLDSLTAAEAKALTWDWKFWARPDQLEPANSVEDGWYVWLILAGRGFGKTRTGAEFIRDKAATPNRRLALVAPTAGDGRDIMIEGESGILNVYPPNDRPKYEPSKRRITWRNGTRATIFSAEEPERLRGPQHHFAWADELAAWKYPETWDQLQFGLRLGEQPLVVATTTPKPRKFMLDLVKQPGVHITRGSTFRNAANLAPTFRAAIVRKYEGTTLGRQELEGELLEESPGALWTRRMIEALRVTEHPPLRRIVVAIDPAGTSEEGSDETGMVTAGIGYDGHAYILSDVSARYTPDGWANRAIFEYRSRMADKIIGEANFGGDMIEALLRAKDKTIPYKKITASRGKAIRAEPISALYEQGRVHHVGGFALLEDQMCQWTPDSDISPDRMDALVWALTELMVTGAESSGGAPSSIGGSSRWNTTTTISRAIPGRPTR